MKKKAILLLFTLLSVTVSFAQTEEETILWIEQYGLKMIAPHYSENYFSRMEIENNTIILREEFPNETNGYGGTFIENRINMNDFGKMFLDYNVFPPNVNGRHFNLWFSTPKGVHPLYFKPQGGDGYLGHFTLPFNHEDDAHRFAKAILHLAKLKGARPKPVVKENTF